MREDRLAVIAALITEPLCAACISSKVGVTSGELTSYLGQIGTLFHVQDQIDRCRACRALTTVFSLRRD